MHNVILYSFLLELIETVCLFWVEMDSKGNAYYTNLLSGQINLDGEFSVESLDKGGPSAQTPLKYDPPLRQYYKVEKIKT